MSPAEKNNALEIQALAAEGRYFAAFVARIEYLRQRANDFLGQLDVRIENDPAYTYGSLAEEYSVHSEVLGEEIARRDAVLTAEAEREDLMENEWNVLQLKSVDAAKLSAVKLIYRGLANFLHEFSVPGPTDAERLAKLMLVGMDLASLSCFCSQIDAMPDQIEQERLARAQTLQREKRAEGGRKTAGRPWHDPATIGAVVFKHFNPESQPKDVKPQVASFVVKMTGERFEMNAGLDKVLRDKSKLQRASLIFNAHLKGEKIADPKLVETLAKAMETFGSPDTKPFTPFKAAQAK